MEETSGNNSLSYTVNLDISEAKKNAEELAKAYADLQVQVTDIVVTIDVDSAEEQIKSLTDQLKELQGVLENNKDSVSIYKDVLSELKDNYATLNSGVDEFKSAMETIDNVVSTVSGLYTEFSVILGNIITTQGAATLAAGDAALAQELLSEGLITTAEAEAVFTSAQVASAAATDAVIVGMELFRVALASTGVGLLLVALGSLVAYFTETQEGIDEVSRALEPLEIGFNSLSKLAIDLGRGIVNAFSLDGLKKFGDLIESQVINRFKALGIIMDGLIHFDFAKVGVGLVQSATGVVDFTGKISSGFQSLQAFGGKIVDVASKVSDLREQQGKQAASQGLDLQKQGTIVDQSKEIASDPTKDQATREAAVKTGLAAIKEELRLKNSLLELNLQIAALESAGKPSTLASEKALNEIKTKERDNIKAAATASKALESTIKAPKVRKAPKVPKTQSSSKNKDSKAIKEQAPIVVDPAIALNKAADAQIATDIKTYADKKALFDEYEAYKLKVGEKTADEVFKNDLGGFKSYQAYLEAQVPKDSTASVLTVKQNYLLTNKEIPAARSEQSKDTRKELEQALADTESTNEKRLVLQQKYQREVDILNKNGDTKNAAQAQKNGDEALKAFDIANGKLNVSDELQKTSDAFKSLADSTKGLDGGLSNVFKALSGITAATATTIKGITGIQSGFKDFNKTSEIAGGGFAGDLAGGLAIAGPAASAVTAVLGVTKSVLGFFKASKQSAIDSAKALQTYQNSLVIGQVSYNELLRSQALTAANVTDATLAQLDAKEKLLGVQKSQAAADEATLLAQIQAQGQQVTGEHTVKSGGIFGVGKKTSVVQDTAGVSSAGYDDLLKLYTEGKLTDSTKTWFEALQKVHDETTAIATETQANEDAINQALTATTSSSIADSIIQGFKDGKRSAADFAGDFKTLMSDAMYKAIESNYLTPAIDAFYKKFAEASKNGLTADEEASLKSEYDGIIATTAQQTADVDKITGGTGATTGVSGAVVGQAITEDTANRALGIWIGQYDTVKTMSGTIGDMYLLATQSFSTTIAIAENTLRTANNTDGIGDKLDKIVVNTSSTGTTSLDQSLRNSGIKG